MIKICIDCKDDFKNEARYIFQTLFRNLGLRYNEIKLQELNQFNSEIFIYYGNSSITTNRNSFLIQISAVDYYKSLTNIQLRHVIKADDFCPSFSIESNLCYLFSKPLKSLNDIWYEDQETGAPLISKSERTFNCSIDFITTVFYLLSLENERQTKKRDSHNRFQKVFSPLNNEIYDLPIVDQYLNLFEKFLQASHKQLDNSYSPQNRWPNKHSFAIALSHDVDRIRTWTFSKIKRTLKESRNTNFWPKSFQIMQSLTIKENWSGNFNYITEVENKYNAHSTFFFTSKPRIYTDPQYQMNSAKIKRGINAIINNKSSIGLHGTIHSANSENLLIDEKEILTRSTQADISGNRQHYLMFDHNKTFVEIEKAKFKYDSTLGFDGELGYRCGTSLPFQPFNIENKKPYSFWEIPLILMDTVLLLESKLYLKPAEAWEVIEQYLEWTYKNNLCLTLNWHNNNINLKDAFGYANLYGKILKWAYERNAWLCSPDELCNWWQSKSEDSS